MLWFLFAVTPMSHYYIIAGIIYQAPDAATLVNSRLVSQVLISSTFKDWPVGGVACSNSLIFALMDNSVGGQLDHFKNKNKVFSTLKCYLNFQLLKLLTCPYISVSFWRSVIPTLFSPVQEEWPHPNAACCVISFRARSC